MPVHLKVQGIPEEDLFGSTVPLAAHHTPMEEVVEEMTVDMEEEVVVEVVQEGAVSREEVVGDMEEVIRRALEDTPEMARGLKIPLVHPSHPHLVQMMTATLTATTPVLQDTAVADTKAPVR